MKYLIVFFLFVSLYQSFGQNIQKGKLIEIDSEVPVPFAHIQNLTQNKGTISNRDGLFKLPINLGDSLWISAVGYKEKGVIIQKEWFHLEIIVIQMKSDTLELNPVVVNELPTESAFKKKVMETEIADSSFVIFGIPEEVIPAPDPTNEYAAPRITAGSPFGMIYRGLSKKEKEKKKMQEIMENTQSQRALREKFNRKLVQELTLLEGDRLTDFMVYCDFSEDFLLNSTEYQIAEAIIEKLEDFKKTLKS